MARQANGSGDQVRLPPHSNECEQMILGACLMSPADSIQVALESLPPTGEAFYDLRHRLIFTALARMHVAGLPIDAVTLHQHLVDAGQSSETGGIAYLSSLMEQMATVVTLPQHVGVVLEMWRRRRMIRACVEGAAKCYDLPQDQSGGPSAVATVLTEVEASVLAANENSRESRALPIAECVAKSIDTIETSFKHRNQGLLTGISTGFGYLDKLIMGLQPRQVYYVGGQQSTGKTSFLLTLALHLAVERSNPVKVGILSIESAWEEIVPRMLCNLTGANFMQLHSGHLSERDLSRLSEAAPRLSGSQVWIDDSNGMTPLDVRLKARRMKSRYGVDVILIDHLHRIVVPEARGDLRLGTNMAVAAVRWVARELDVPVVCAAQLNREAKKQMRGGKARHAEATDLRESAAVEEDADFIGILQKDFENDDDPEADDWPMVMHVVKQRNGKTGPCQFLFRRPCFRYEDRYMNTGSESGGERRRAIQQSLEGTDEI